MKKKKIIEKIQNAENVFEQLEIMGVCYAVCVADLDAKGMTNRYKDYFIIITDLDRSKFLVKRSKKDEPEDGNTKLIGGRKFILDGFESGEKDLTFERTLTDLEVDFFRRNLLYKFNKINFS